MAGSQYQYDPAEMFGEWIRRGGRAQAEFARAFGQAMGAVQGGRFDPLAALAEMSAGARRGAAPAAGGGAPGGQGGQPGMAQALQAFMGWGAYKTSVGSNGRISIPEAERDALGLAEGDLVQVVVMPVARVRGREVKK